MVKIRRRSPAEFLTIFQPKRGRQRFEVSDSIGYLQNPACNRSERGQRKISRRSTLRNADTQPVMKSSASVLLNNERGQRVGSSRLSSRPTTSTPTSFALFLSDSL